MNRLEKAAAFGAMMGKRALFGRKFTPDLKLQQALMAEREKLIDVWEEGGTDWSQETHPDTGGNPDFNRRWNKAFNSKEEVEPKAPPTPLHESKPSWFPFRTQGMIDKARDAEYLRSDNEEAWDANDWKTEMALRDDHTREGVNNILNHYLDRNHGIVKNPYKAPADLDGHVDYKGLVQKNVPWKPSTDIDNINALFEETQFPDYKSPANRQKLFDQYYPYLDLAPPAKPSKKGPIAKAAAFGAMMGKRAAEVVPPTASKPQVQDRAPRAPDPSYIKDYTDPNNSEKDIAQHANYVGGPHNRVGTLPSASTSPRAPFLAGPNGFREVENYSNFLDRNYSENGTLGSSRLKFHNDLSNQLDSSELPYSGPKQSPTGAGVSRASLINANRSAWPAWTKRTEELAKETHEKAPIRHINWTGENSPNGAPMLKGVPHQSDYRYGRAPVDYNPISNFNNILNGNYNKFPYAEQASKAVYNLSTKAPEANKQTLIDISNTIHPGKTSVQYSYSPKFSETEYNAKFPRSFASQAGSDLHEATHAGWQDNNPWKRPSVTPTGKTGNPIRSGAIGSYRFPSNVSTAVAEAGAVFNEVGQGARAFKDVTGKPLQGSYEVAPDVEMDYRELGDLAKKYKPSDLNSPAGQIWLRRALANSGNQGAKDWLGRPKQPGTPLPYPGPAE